LPKAVSDARVREIIADRQKAVRAEQWQELRPERDESNPIDRR
jgi:hypothetical protein